MDPTAALLWEAARPAVRRDEVRAALDAGADVALAGRLGQAHGIGPLLWRALETADRLSLVGGRDGDCLRTEAQLRRAQSLMLLSQAVELAIDPLRGLEPVVWKGPAVATRYPDPALRPMADIDIIVPSDRHADAVVALERAGWQQVVHAGENYDTALTHPSLPGLPLELHFSLNSWRHRPNRLRSDDLWERRRPIDILGTPAFGLAPEDEVVAIAAHAGKPFHVFSRLIWVTDLAVVSEGVDWGAVRDRAEEAECRTVVAVGLRLASRLGTKPPWWVIELPESRARRRALDQILDPDWPAWVELHFGPVRGGWLDLQERLRYALADRPSRAAMLMIGQVVDAPPGERMQRMGSLLGRATRGLKGARWSGRRSSPG